MGAIYDRLRLWLGVPLPAGPFNWVVEERSYMGSVIKIAFRVEWERPVFVGEGDLLDQPIMMGDRVPWSGVAGFHSHR